MTAAAYKSLKEGIKINQVKLRNELDEEIKDDGGPISVRSDKSDKRRDIKELQLMD